MSAIDLTQTRLALAVADPVIQAQLSFLPAMGWEMSRSLRAVRDEGLVWLI